MVLRTDLLVRIFKLRKIIFIPFLLLSLTYGKYSAGSKYTEMACQKTFHKSCKEVEEERKKDYLFSYSDRFCCCSDKILKIFKKLTKKNNKDANKGTDYLISSFAEGIKVVKMEIKTIKNRKLINAMYSFREQETFEGKPPKKPRDINGCIPLDFNKESDQELYMDFMDSIENGGAGSSAYTLQSSQSSAYGRYQFIDSTASEYCAKAGGGCCETWKSSPACQDEMFKLFTADNMDKMAENGIPLNTCTVYIAHQQGIGGLNWLLGGSSPYSSMDALQNVVQKNVTSDFWSNAVASGKTNSEEGLRETFLAYWDDKLGGDIANSGGTSYNMYDFDKEAEKFEQISEKKKKALWREGILLDTSSLIHSLKMEKFIDKRK